MQAGRQGRLRSERQRRALLALVLLASWSMSRAASAASESDSSGAAVSAPNRIPAARATAVRMAELPEDPSSFTTVIDVGEFAGEDKTAAELIAESVGVQVRHFGGRGQFSEVSIRGSTGQQVVVLLDGIRLNGVQSGTVDLSTIPSQLLERVEISRGGGAVQAGADAVGGVIDLVAIEPTDELHVSSAFGAGSFGTFEGSLGTTGRAGPVGWVGAYTGFHTDGDWKFQSPDVFISSGDQIGESREFTRINNAVDYHAGLLRGVVDLGESTALEATDYLFFTSRGRPGLATGFGEGPLGGQNPDAHQRVTRNVFSLETEWDELFDGAALAAVRGFHRYERSRYTDPTPPLAQPPETTNIDQSAGLRLMGEGEVRPFDIPNLGRLSLETRRDWLDASESGDHTRWVVGATLQDEISMLGERATIAPALRYDFTEGFGGEWVPRLGLSGQPWPWLRIKGNVERTYRVPNFDELYLGTQGAIRGNPNLEPENALDADLGFELAFAKLGPLERVSFELAGFYRDIRNSIVWVPVSGQVVAPKNTGPARVAGLELAAALEALRWARFSANYTLVDSEQEGNGEPLPGRAEHELHLRLRLGPASELVKLTGEAHYTSEIPVTLSAGTIISARWVFDASLVFDVAKLSLWEAGLWPESLLLSVVGTNLSDRSVYDAQYFPQPGRSLMFKVSSRW